MGCGSRLASSVVRISTSTAAAVPPSPAPEARCRWLIGVVVVMTGLNLRTAVTSIGPLLAEIQHDLGLSSGLAGLLTTLPVISFAVLGTLAPTVSGRLGEHRTIAASLVLMTGGLLGRAMTGSGAVFLVLSTLSLVGGAVGNVLLPGLVKRYFPDHTGLMVGAYTTALALGQTLGAALAVPLAGLDGPQGWRLGVGLWAAVAAVAVLPWLPLLRGDRPGRDRHLVVPPRRLLRSRLAWALVVFFSMQSIQAYVVVGWFPQFFRDAGMSPGRAGLLVGAISALTIPVSMVVPTLAVRLADQRPLVAVAAACYLAGYCGMLAAPVSLAWVSAVLVGLGLGAFPLALTMFGLRARTPETTAALSTFSQGLGYLIAAAGPLLVGVLLGATGGWGAPFALLFVVLALMTAAGWYAGRDRYVDDEVRALHRPPAGDTTVAAER